MIAFLLVAALCQAEPASPTPGPETRAQTDVGPDIVVEAPPEADDPVVCEIQVTTGSIVRRRVCRTQSEIEREQRDSEFRLRNMRKWGHIREMTVM